MYNAELDYVLNDHLGSPVWLVSGGSSPAITEEYAFDSWGRRRNPTDWSYTSVPVAQKLIRGFTGHEMLDEFVAINMNARVYDPVTGRFVQADDIIPEEDNLQTYNRFAYCKNNPLRFIDPTGHDGEIPGYIPPPTFNADEYFSYLPSAQTPYYLNTNYTQNISTQVNANMQNISATTSQQINSIVNNASSTTNDLVNSITASANEAWTGIQDYFANVGTAAEMTLGWITGFGEDSRTFSNDRVANAMRNSAGIDKARTDYYTIGRTTNRYNFGLEGLWNAGFDPH